MLINIIDIKHQCSLALSLIANITYAHYYQLGLCMTPTLTFANFVA